MNHSITDEKYEDLNNVVDRLKQKLANLEKEKEELKEKNLEQANIISNIDLEARQMLIDSVQVLKKKNSIYVYILIYFYLIFCLILLNMDFILTILLFI